MKDVLSVVTFVMGALCFDAPGCRSEPEWPEH
jgi:hypothetical protein